MNKEQVVELAKQAGYQHPDAVGDCEDFAYFDIQRFTTLVGNAALEEAAQKCMTHGKSDYPAVFAEAIRNLKEPTP